jgi:hypothetical protein
MPKKRNSNDGEPVKKTVLLDPEVNEIVEAWIQQYHPRIRVNDLVNGAIRFMKRQAVLGLGADCQPNNPNDYSDEILRISKAAPQERKVKQE